MNPQPLSEQPEDAAMIHQVASIDSYNETEYIEASIAPLEPPEATNPFITPWSLGALGILLIANTLMSWNQWQKKTPELKTALVTYQDRPIRIPTALNLTAAKIPLVADTISIIPAPVASPVSLAVAAPPIPSVKPVTASSGGTLTRALLPASVQQVTEAGGQIVQPPLMPSYPITPPPAPAPVAPKVKVPKAVIPLAQKPAASQPSPAPSPAIINERMVEELRNREETGLQQTFYQKRKQELLELKAPQNNEPLPPQPEAPKPPEKIPGSIIIDRSGAVVK
ncbi:MAG: hypothetical protein N5P05_004002 [Chroococcopsis gigantea SAG 12.99]|jgi:hypothetical protein|nr:hypothetical protein [Chroococcopsis gigantea SAG 12.99]